MANAFMCSMEDRLQDQGKLPKFYKRHVDDTLSIIPDTETAEAFLSSLNESPLFVNFTMELGEHGKLPFLATEIRKCNATGRAFKLSSTWHLFQLECDLFTQTFQSQTFQSLLQSTISNFITKKVSGDPISTPACNVNETPVGIVLPFKVSP